MSNEMMKLNVLKWNLIYKIIYIIQIYGIIDLWTMFGWIRECYKKKVGENNNKGYMWPIQKWWFLALIDIIIRGMYAGSWVVNHG